MIKKGSLNKFTVWRKSKNTILSKMDKGLIDPEKAKKILEFIKLTLKNISTLEDLGNYCAMLAKKFPELQQTIENFRLDEEEKLEESISLIIDKLMGIGHFEEAENLMNQLEGTKNIQEKIEIVKKSHKEKFEKAYKEIFGSEEGKI